MFRRTRTSTRSARPSAPTFAMSGQRGTTFVVDPGTDRRRDLARRAAVAAMLAACDDLDEREAFLRQVRGGVRTV